MQRKCWVLRFHFVYFSKTTIKKVLFLTRNLYKAVGKIMATSARWKTQGRSPGVRGARSRGMENVTLNEITTARCEPSEIATSKGLKLRWET